MGHLSLWPMGKGKKCRLDMGPRKYMGAGMGFVATNGTKRLRRLGAITAGMRKLAEREGGGLGRQLLWHRPRSLRLLESGRPCSADVSTSDSSPTAESDNHRSHEECHEHHVQQ